jgi:hypothetical protein
MMSSYSDKIVRIAVALDPRTRKRLLVNYNKENVFSALRDGYHDFAATFTQLRGAAAAVALHPVAPEVVDEKEEQVQPPPAKRQRSVLDMTNDDEDVAPLSELDEFNKERGIELTDCPLKWWAARATRFPILAEMARVHLAVPASSAPSERVFSVARLVLTEKRRRLDASRVARLMFLKRNMSLYQELTGEKN